MKIFALLFMLVVTFSSVLAITETGGDSGTIVIDSGGDIIINPGENFCGNGIAEEPEECDGSDFWGATCSSFGFNSGSLSCDSECRIITSGCTNTDEGTGNPGTGNGGGGGGSGGGSSLTDTDLASSNNYTILFIIEGQNIVSPDKDYLLIENETERREFDVMSFNENEAIVKISSRSFTLPLQEQVSIDLDGDGKKDIQLGGDRGWLYLTADTSSIGNWVDQGPHPDITLKSHIWLSGKSGVATSVYIKMKSSGFEGEVVLIPVFNYLCDGDPRIDTSCVSEAHASPPWPPFSGEDDFSQIKFGSDNYHIIAFEPFYITCVDKKGDCPGAELAGIDGDGPVVEGFFLSDYPVSPDSSQGCDINLGNCTISLSN